MSDEGAQDSSAARLTTHAPSPHTPIMSRVGAALSSREVTRIVRVCGNLRPLGLWGIAA